MQAPATQRPIETKEQIVTVCLGAETFGLPIGQVESIASWEPLTRLPRLPRFIAGLYNQRGRAVPVLDLRMRLDLPIAETGTTPRIVMAHFDGTFVGLIVDSVREVLWIDAAQIETKIAMVSNETSGNYLRGVVNLPQGFVILLDLQKLLTDSEITALEKLQARSENKH